MHSKHFLIETLQAKHSIISFTQMELKINQDSIVTFNVIISKEFIRKFLVHIILTLQNLRWNNLLMQAALSDSGGKFASSITSGALVI